MDEKDRQLLQLLQTDARLTAEQLGARLGLSASQAARRRARLEAEGLIAGYAARIDPLRAGLGVQAFIRVQMAVHSPDAAQRLTRRLQTIPQVVDGWTLTGDADYLLHVYCADLQELNRLVHETLLPLEAVAKVQSQIVMNHFKSDAPLPL